jgi:hypothetical protein
VQLMLDDDILDNCFSAECCIDAMNCVLLVEVRRCFVVGTRQDLRSEFDI